LKKPKVHEGRMHTGISRASRVLKTTDSEFLSKKTKW